MFDVSDSLIGELQGKGGKRIRFRPNFLSLFSRFLSIGGSLRDRCVVLSGNGFQSGEDEMLHRAVLDPHMAHLGVRHVAVIVFHPRAKGRLGSHDPGCFQRDGIIANFVCPGAESDDIFQRRPVRGIRRFNRMAVAALCLVQGLASIDLYLLEGHVACESGQGAKTGGSNQGKMGHCSTPSKDVPTSELASFANMIRTASTHRATGHILWSYFRKKSRCYCEGSHSGRI